MELKWEHLGMAAIVLILITATLFVGFEFGKDYVARNFVTEAVASIDPFIYCDIHEGSVKQFGLDPNQMSYHDMQNYAVSIYVEMVAYYQNNQTREMMGPTQ